MPKATTILETERLLRGFRELDLHDFYEYLSDEAVVKFEPYKAMCLSEVQVGPNKRIASDEMIAVVLKETGKLIGNLYFGKKEFGAMELGYVFNRQYWNRHYARESCRALIEKAFDEGVPEYMPNVIPKTQHPGVSWKPGLYKGSPLPSERVFLAGYVRQASLEGYLRIFPSEQRT